LDGKTDTTKDTETPVWIPPNSEDWVLYRVTTERAGDDSILDGDFPEGITVTTRDGVMFTPKGLVEKPDEEDIWEQGDYDED